MFFLLLLISLIAPSSVLQFRSPMELLSKSSSNASSLSPKIFGGLCFVHNPLSRKVVVSVLEILPKSFQLLLLFLLRSLVAYVLFILLITLIDNYKPKALRCVSIGIMLLRRNISVTIIYLARSLLP